MAGTTLKRRDTFGLPENAVRDLVIQMNKLIDDVELVRAAVKAMAVQIDADNGTIGTDYEAAAGIVAIATAATMTAAKIGDAGGTAISA
jgi:predicted oxidoreductase